MMNSPDGTPFTADEATVLVDTDGGTVTISSLLVHDEALAHYLATQPPERQVEELQRVLAIGVRGINAMSAGISMDDIAAEVRRILAEADSATTDHVGSALERGSQIMAQALDPALDTSLTGQTLARFGKTAETLAGALDPNRRDSHGARLLDRIDALVGEGGTVESMLADALDGSRDESALGQVRLTLTSEIRELRDLLMAESGRSGEAQRGTAKGFDYEESVGAHLRTIARSIGSATVEDTGRVTGVAGGGRIVGDFVVTAPCGTRVVVEAKNAAHLGLTGSGGVLDELDRAMSNRSADWAVCVSAQDAFPGEVGSFGIYGNRVLVVDDGDGVLLTVAIRWVMAMAAHRTAPRGATVDIEAIRELLERIRGLAGHISRTKKNLAGVRSSVDGIRGDLDDLRIRLIDLVEEAVATLVSGREKTQPSSLVA